MIWVAAARLYDALAGADLRQENDALRAEVARLRPRAALGDQALETLDELYGRAREAADRLGLRGTTRTGAE